MWSPGPMELGIIFGIVLLVFGTGKLRTIGKDLGGAIGEFRNSMKPGDAEEEKTETSAPSEEDSTEEHVKS